MSVIVHPNSTSEIVESIVDLIQQRELKVGDKLPPIRHLAALLGCKVNTVRDALLQAQAMGLVRVLPRAGAFIQQTSIPTNGLSLMPVERDFAWELQSGGHNLFHLLDARRAIELELGQRAAEGRRLEDLLPLRKLLESMRSAAESQDRARFVEFDIEFHLQIAGLGGNAVLLLMLKTILEQLRPYLERLPWGPARQESTDRMHAELYRALVEADAEALCREMRRHLSVAYDALLDVVRTPPQGEQDT